MELPRGLFWLRAASGISEPHVISLMRMADSLYREILILTDLPISYDGDSGKVTINADPVGPYDYSFITDARPEMRRLHDRFLPMLSTHSWMCWMPPRPNVPTPWSDARHEANTVLSGYSFSAVCHPNVVVDIGPNRDVIFAKTGVISSVMCPNSGDGFWREIFRSSGAYGAKARVMREEM